jgi:hypothetical protein
MPIEDIAGPEPEPPEDQTGIGRDDNPSPASWPEHIGWVNDTSSVEVDPEGFIDRTQQDAGKAIVIVGACPHVKRLPSRRDARCRRGFGRD